MKLPMSISLKVVRRAFVFCDSFSLRAMVWRILLILTLVSVLVPLISEGAFFAVVEVVEAPDDFCGAACGVAGAGLGGSALGVGGVYGAAWAGAGSSFFAGAGVLALGAALPLASVSNSIKSAPTSTLSPSSAKNLVMTPECYDKISTVTLSVSIRATTSSAST